MRRFLGFGRWVDGARGYERDVGQMNGKFRICPALVRRSLKLSLAFMFFVIVIY
jgi:hypothetical protein